MASWTRTRDVVPPVAVKVTALDAVVESLNVTVFPVWLAVPASAGEATTSVTRAVRTPARADRMRWRGGKATSVSGLMQRMAPGINAARSTNLR